MLQTLKSYSPQEAALILASVAWHLVPEELTEPTTYLNTIDDNMRRRVLDEVYQKLGLSQEDKTEKSQARILDYIGKELSRAALAGSDLQEIRNRVGQQGNLRPALYKVILTGKEEKAFHKYGISRTQIKTSVNNADDFQHLLPSLFGPVSSDVSLFVRSYPNEDDPFSILVQALRDGAKLIVQHAFKIYHSDLDFDKEQEPLDLLLKFVDKYGLRITVGDETGKFVMYKSVPHYGSPISGNFFDFNADDEPTAFRSGFHIKATENTIEIAVGYVINETKYLGDLEKHK
jgi:hypothetical protein